MFLGQAFYSLEGLGYLMDNPHTLPIVGTDMQPIGELTMNVRPCYPDGNEDIDEEQCPDDPSELISQVLDFKVEISHASQLPANFCREVYCEYKFYLDNTQYQTEVQEGKNQNPRFNYNHQHSVECVTQSLLDYLSNEKLQIKLFGIQDLQPRKNGGQTFIQSSMTGGAPKNYHEPKNAKLDGRQMDNDYNPLAPKKSGKGNFSFK